MPRSSPAVYRRRRLVVFGGLLVLLAAVGVGIWVAVAQPWAQDAAGPTSSATPSASSPETETDAAESPGPSPSGEETPGTLACQAADIEVQAVADSESYGPGVLPQLSISLTNTGATDCTIDVGSGTQVFTVKSGEDVWWRSTDCQENPSSMIVTLAAGQTATSAEPVQWDRTRSSADTCEQENRPRAPGGGASYHVSVEIGGFEGRGTQQILLY